MSIKFRQLLGKFLFFVGWPLWLLYFSLTVRTRVLIICGDELLVVKGWIGDQKWSLPGGGLHLKEQPVVGARREVQEETGVILSTSELLHIGRSSITRYCISIKYHCFVATIDHYPNFKRQRLEISEIEWMKIDKLTKQNAGEDTLDVIRIWRSTSVSGTI